MNGVPSRVVLFIGAVLAAVTACDRLPGMPSEVAPPSIGSEAWTRATFNTYCRGCHASGADGASIPLMDRSYWTFASDERVIAATANGQGVMMPAFSQSAGGPFTDDEVMALARGMRGVFGGSSGAGISATIVPGDRANGEGLFANACAPCHRDGAPGGSLVDPAFLALVSDQGLWASTLAGRAVLGMPAWNHAMPSRPSGLTQEEAADIIAFVASHRAAKKDAPP